MTDVDPRQRAGSRLVAGESMGNPRPTNCDDSRLLGWEDAAIAIHELVDPGKSYAKTRASKGVSAWPEKILAMCVQPRHRFSS